MQILMNGSQKKTRLSSVRKIFRTKKAQIVISGMLNPQIQLSWIPPEGGPDPAVRPERLVPWIAFMSPAGTAKEQFGFAFLRKLRSVGSGRGIGGCVRPALSCQAAIRNGSLSLLHTSIGGHPGMSLLMRRNTRIRYSRLASWKRPIGAVTCV